MARCRPNWQNPMFLSRNPPRFGVRPAAKTKIPTFLQLFCDCGRFSVSKKQNRTAVQPITLILRLDSQLGISKQSVIAKKLHCEPIFCFWASWAVPQGGLLRHWGAVPRGGPLRHWEAVPQGGPLRHRKSTPLQRCKKSKSESTQLRMPSLCFRTILRLL